MALLRIHRRSGTSDSDEAQALRAEVIQAAGRLTTSSKSRNPGLVRDLAAEVGDELTGIAQDALRFGGLGPEDSNEPSGWTSYEAADSLSESVSDSRPALRQFQESLRQESDKGAF